VELARGAAARLERIIARTRAATLRAYLPVDVSGDALADATALAGRYLLPWPSRACTAAMKACFRCCRASSPVCLVLRQHYRQPHQTDA